MGAIVLVVSKGDDRLVEIDGRRGWHFPRADDGRYAGYHPKDGDRRSQHLEELRAKGAGFLVFPTTAMWWLDYYPALKSHLEGRYKLVARDDSCLVFDVREAGQNGHAEEVVTVTAQAEDENAALEPEGGAVGIGSVVQSGTAGAVTQGSGRMTPDQYGGVVGGMQAVIKAHVPPGANVIVVSRGDDELVNLEGRHGWHYPQDETGRYRGYHPANDDDAISHLEELRAKGGEYSSSRAARSGGWTTTPPWPITWRAATGWRFATRAASSSSWPSRLPWPWFPASCRMAPRSWSRARWPPTCTASRHSRRRRWRSETTPTRCSPASRRLPGAESSSWSFPSRRSPGSTAIRPRRPAFAVGTC